MAKLSEFLPDVPEVAKTIANLNEQINLLQLSKASGDTGQAHTLLHRVRVCTTCSNMNMF